MVKALGINEIEEVETFIRSNEYLESIPVGANTKDYYGTYDKIKKIYFDFVMRI